MRNIALINALLIYIGPDKKKHVLTGLSQFRSEVFRRLEFDKNNCVGSFEVDVAFISLFIM